MTQRSSRLIRLFSIFIIVGSVCFPASDAAAQRRSTGTLPTEIVRASTTLSPAQKQQVSQFTDEQVEKLAKGDRDDVVSARDSLVQAARLPGASTVFLRSYAESIIPAVTPILEGDDSMRAENALRVIAFLRTPESVSLLVESIDPSASDDAALRLVAAGLLSVAFEEAENSALSSPALFSAARSIAQSLAAEADWLVVLEELRAMNTVARNPELSDDNRSQVRILQFKAFKDLSDRIARGDEPSELSQAVYRAILGLRGRMLDNRIASDVSVDEVARTLRSTLVQVAGAAVKQWKGLDANPAMMESYEGTLRVGAQLLSLLEGKQDPAINALAAPLSAAMAASAGSDERTAAKARLEKAVAAAK